MLTGGKKNGLWSEDLRDTRAEVNSGYNMCNSSVKKIIVSEGIQEIGKCTLGFSLGLEIVILPATLKYVDDYAFNLDYNLTDIYCIFPSKPENWSEEWLATRFERIPVSPNIHWRGSRSRGFITITLL